MSVHRDDCGVVAAAYAPPGRAQAEGEEMNSGPWSPDEDERLRTLARSGFSLTHIAHELERVKSSVQARARGLKIATARDRNPMRARPPTARSKAKGQ